MFNPEKYHMNFCHEFQGLGKTFGKENLKEVCQVCGGGRCPRLDIGRVSFVRQRR